MDVQLTVCPSTSRGHADAPDSQLGKPSHLTASNPGHYSRMADCTWDVRPRTVNRLCRTGHLNEAAQALTVLVHRNNRVSSSLLSSVLKKCVAERNLDVGRRVHHLIVKLGYESDAHLGSHLLRLYALRGRLKEAMHVFSRMMRPDAFMWFSVISAHAKHGHPSQALHFYRAMRSAGVRPDGHVFVAALQACALAKDLESGIQVHHDVLETGYPPNCFICSTLVHMYSKCGKLEVARQLFDTMAIKNIFTWTAMLTGYAEHGLGQEALALYEEMEQEGHTLPDDVTYICVLKACASVGALQHGRQLHLQVLNRGYLESNILVANCLVYMYAKCGQCDEARRVFDSMPTKTVVTWNTMISGYAELELGQEALALYAEMEREGLARPDGRTFAALLKACASAGALQYGKQLHSQILERGLLPEDVVVGSSLVDMYAKCGKMEDACKVFESLGSRRDVVVWNAMINGYGRSNDAQRAAACFEELVRAGVQPDDTTFICLLKACSHEGLVHEGRQYFRRLVEEHHGMPHIGHHNCMIDLLGRAGHLDEAESMLLACQGQRNAVGLMSLLNACRIFGDIKRATRCFESLVGLDPLCASAYICMASMYADAGRWAEVGMIEKLRKSAGASKKPAVAGIELNRQVHTFTVGAGRDDMLCKAQTTNARLQEEGGHVPHTKLVWGTLSEMEKQDELCGHAEKLALAYGLLNSPEGTPLLVTKNLRMCSDCHSSTAIMSRIENRDIIVRDAFRVHRFQAGSCSCKGRP